MSIIGASQRGDGKLRHKLEDAPVSVLIKLLAEKEEREINRILQKDCITVMQVRLLVSLAQREEPLPERALGECLHVSQPALVGLIRRLEGKGLVRTYPSPDDRRSRLVQLTEKGQKVCEENHRAMEQYNEQLTRNFSEEEKTTLQDYLLRMFQNMNSTKGE